MDGARPAGLGDVGWWQGRPLRGVHAATTARAGTPPSSPATCVPSPAHLPTPLFLPSSRQVTSAFAERVVGVPDPADDSIIWWGTIKEGEPPRQIVEGGEYFVLKRLADAGGGHH